MSNHAIEDLLSRFAKSPAMSEILEAAGSDHNNLVIKNIRGGSQSALVAVLQRRLARPILLLTSTNERAEILADGIDFFGGSAMLFPSPETLPYETTEPPLHIRADRNRALAALLASNERDGTGAGAGTETNAGTATAENNGETAPGPVLGPVIVAPVDALIPHVLPPESIGSLILDIAWGERLDLDDLALKLVNMGYGRESIVEAPGEFAIRGTIVDLYPPEVDWPFRLDFFGDEIESIREFDPATQRSRPRETEIESVHVLPCLQVEAARERLEAGEPLATLFDFLPPDAWIVLDGPDRLTERVDYFHSVAERHLDEIRALPPEENDSPFTDGRISPESWLLGAKAFAERLSQFPRISLTELGAHADTAAKQSGSKTVTFGTQSFESVKPGFKDFLEIIRAKQVEGFRVAVVCDNPGQVMRLEELFAENEVPAVAQTQRSPEAQSDRTSAPGSDPLSIRTSADVVLLTGELQEGFIFPAAKLLVLTDREIFGRYKRRRVHRKVHHGRPLADAAEINRGDFVVHVDHGIGAFEKIRRQEIDGRNGEFLEIVYQDGDRLLVPVEKLDLVQKYASADGKTPALDKLGQKKWQRRRKKAEEAVRKLAGELLELYAKREAAFRPPFSADSHWQQEFESSFLYQETPDQMRAIQEVKADLMAPRPADRLVCGDVGYGKTEVAIRAAFKVLTEGKQVGILVPTTILAQQHYRTFTERFADYPFRVGMVSRFRSSAENKSVLNDLAEGKVHLVIGTHRLLSKDVKFKDLGLLVIDEEQRFGVKQKEKIKALKPTVDVITLTATPIPRTLHMALAKLRDLSIIQTPPADRLPIKTRTIYFERDAIEEAILRELNRGGQVFFVHNRIATIDEVAQTIRDIVPGARLAVGHGQMDEKELESIMSRFIDREFDILLSTTIIESGIDIPNVNTIIINRADAFGLAQLYQLRGRVGRDVRQAYAYLILPKGQPITDTATKRLAALEEFTELGMGFSIAMRDMEIRGTGNILGKDQSGAISDIGFDLYIQLLEEAVTEMKGEVPADAVWPVDVHCPIDQWLPEDYVPVEAQRIRFYRTLASARNLEDISFMEDELLDRYGPIPQTGVNLLRAFRVKLLAGVWQIDTVRFDKSDRVHLRGSIDTRALAESIGEISHGDVWPPRITFRAGQSVTLHPFEEEEVSSEERLHMLMSLLMQLGAPPQAAEVAAQSVSS